MYVVGRAIKRNISSGRFPHQHYIVPTPGNINVNLGFLARRFSTVSDLFPGLGAGFLNLAGKME
eukprot:COSAG04_NODE_10001_length_814_cov_0.538462_2_plen_63_part_01